MKGNWNRLKHTWPLIEIALEIMSGVLITVVTKLNESAIFFRPLDCYEVDTLLQILFLNRAKSYVLIYVSS